MRIRYPTIRGKCPTCSRAIVLPDAPEATTIHQRTCRGCRTRWQIKRETIRNAGAVRLDQLSFIAKGGDR